MTPEPIQEISVIDYGRIFFRRWRLLAALVVAAATVLPPQPEPSSPLAPDSGPRAAADAILERFRLAARYEAPSPEAASSARRSSSAWAWTRSAR